MSKGTFGPSGLAPHLKRREMSQPTFPQPPKLSSHVMHWQDILLEYFDQPGHDTGEQVAPVHQIIVCLPDTPIPVERQLENHFRAETASAGDVLIAPAGARLRINRQNQSKFMNLSFEPNWLEQVNQEVGGSDRVELMPKAPPLKDVLIQGILLNLKQELENRGLGGNIYVDQLKLTLALHLLRYYTITPAKLPVSTSKRPTPTKGLSRQQLRQVLDYIHANFSQVIKLEDIATLLGISQYYFCRLFRESMGVTPHQYVIAQRVEQAKILLQQPQRQAIADIALACGFSNQSHLCKHFRKRTGTTPKAYRQGV